LHYSALELAGGIAGRLGVLGIGMTVWCAAVSGFLLYRSPNVAQHSVHLPHDSWSFCNSRHESRYRCLSESLCAQAIHTETAAIVHTRCRQDIWLTNPSGIGGHATL